MEICYEFVNYGEDIEPKPGVIVLDVGKKTVPGVIDHHHPKAEPECTASLVVKYPFLVLDHLRTRTAEGEERGAVSLKIITHRLPDFDSVTSIFLVLKLIETGTIDASMEKLAAYTKMVDSASLPEEIDLTSTPYSIIRALFARIKGEEGEINRDRIEEGLRFMRFLHSKSAEGYDIVQNKPLFSGVERFERAIKRIEGDYFYYLSDLSRADRMVLDLPLTSGIGKKKTEALIVKNPKTLLLKDWAKRDHEASSLGDGFTLIVTNFGNKRYILGVDPEKGVNLKGLGDLLNQEEAKKRMALQRPFPLLWYDGNCPFFDFRIIDSPQDETSLSHEEVIRIIVAFSRGFRGIS
jgi:hypothetical protein